jgi:hypothetical protein
LNVNLFNKAAKIGFLNKEQNQMNILRKIGNRKWKMGDGRRKAEDGGRMAEAISHKGK